jgi:hypothetical protein
MNRGRQELKILAEGPSSATREPFSELAGVSIRFEKNMWVLLESPFAWVGPEKALQSCSQV